MHDIISQAEKSRRSLQEMIDRLNRAVDHTLGLIERTEKVRQIEPEAARAPEAVRIEQDAPPQKGAA